MGVRSKKSLINRVWRIEENDLSGDGENEGGGGCGGRAPVVMSLASSSRLEPNVHRNQQQQQNQVARSDLGGAMTMLVRAANGQQQHQAQVRPKLLVTSRLANNSELAAGHSQSYIGQRSGPGELKTTTTMQVHSAAMEPMNGLQATRMPTSPKALEGQQLAAPHLHHHHFRQHAHTCLASRLVAAAAVSQDSPPRFKRHQPHCIHHKPAYQQQKLLHLHQAQQHQHQHNQSSSWQANMNNSGYDDGTSPGESEGAKYKAIRCQLKQQDKSYLLVEYRPQSKQQRGQLGDDNGLVAELGRDGSMETINHTEADKRTTIRFISQLYFLLHLSAILSLLFHHKSLEASRPVDEPLNGRLVKRLPLGGHFVGLDNSSGQYQQALSESVAPTTVSPLPVPLQMDASELTVGARWAPLEQAQGLRPMRAPSDLLVRLLGPSQARLAIHHFLCYLMLTSVAILAGLRLFRLCSGLEPGASGQDHRQQVSGANTGPLDSGHGFYYRTRLDCTPVLIGSISLGLIQLIVIGLDIANNLDSEQASNGGGASSWPTSCLPFLQFIFVSLLMQYILGKVAKKNGRVLRAGEQSRPAESKAPSSPAPSSSEALARQRHCSAWPSAGQQPKARRPSGWQNIALAHLLVTSILLWLMKLNSISLFVHNHQDHPPANVLASIHGSSGRREPHARSQPAPDGQDKRQEPSLTRPTWLRPNQSSVKASDHSTTSGEAPVTLREPETNDHKRQEEPEGPQTTKSVPKKAVAGHSTPIVPSKPADEVVRINKSLVEVGKLGRGSQPVPTPLPANLSHFQSSLPKRMTAFVQTRAATTSRPATPRMGMSPVQASASSTSISNPTTSSPRQQKARLVISRIEEPQSQLELEQQRQRRPKFQLPESSTGRPFPSVETGDPPEGVTLSADADGQDEAEEGDGGGGDEQEADLEALLPPVPSYNETGGDDEQQAAASQLNLTLVTAPQQPPTAKASQRTQTESLVASQEQPQPTFADYLLPIVQQYHILIIAILFNMWLDYLRKSGRLRRPQAELAPAQRPNLIAVEEGKSPARRRHHWPPGAGPMRHRHRSRSMDSLHQQAQEELGSGSSLSRCNSLRSSSSEQLLWASGGRSHPRSPPANRQCSSMSLAGASPDFGANLSGAKQRATAKGQASNSVCALFFGLLVVSASLTVILLGLELLALVAQCAAQLLSVLVCSLGLLLTRRKSPAPSAQGSTVGHRQCFHYLFLLAAYYCGLCAALSLGQQNSPQPPLAHQALLLLQRHLQRPHPHHAHLLLCHALLAAKGSLLLLQVTLQTLLIRASARRPRGALRQVYTFLMFANLSLWAMELCEQQRQMQRLQAPPSTPAPVQQHQHQHQHSQTAEGSAEGLGQLAASVVTLSHLYHGLVFTQH